MLSAPLQVLHLTLETLRCPRETERRTLAQDEETDINRRWNR